MNVLVVHDYGPLGRLVLESLRETSLPIRPLLISKPDGVDISALEDWIPEDTDLIVNTFWHNDPEQAERDPEAIRQWTFSIPMALAEYARGRDMALLQLSTCYVFDGRKQSAYITSNPGQPFSQLGNWQWESEQALRTVLPRHMILRTGWSLDRFIRKISESTKGATQLELSSRHRGQPVAMKDLARVIRALVMQIDCGAEVWGTYQYAGAEEISQYELGQAIVNALPALEDVHVVDGVPAWARLEPENTTLGCIKIRNTFGVKQLPWRNRLKEESQLAAHPTEVASPDRKVTT
ncbi:sugar nucleotide-binding protein [Marinobacter fonticola]|uniref:sugar nucleotide-binding protein n=1 Tax=Marinobacter fonticola TaxID=2603215 RepID=UPI0011E693C9|nr:sugar nucleotide-binding protein [Marinobacter fonticola]